MECESLLRFLWARLASAALIAPMLGLQRWRKAAALHMDRTSRLTPPRIQRAGKGQ